MPTRILYLPGLGDRYDPFRRSALAVWESRRITAELVSLEWYDGRSLDEKVARVEQAINQVHSEEPIVLIGESAGGTIALHVAAHNQRVSKVITLCGVTQRNTPISNYLRKRAPALDQAVGSLPELLNIPIESIRAASDSVVGKRYSIAPNAHEHVLPTLGHFFTIVLCLTVLKRYMKRLALK